MTSNLTSMKPILVLVLILLLVMVALPVAMGGMDAMGECPLCTSPDSHVTLGICAALLASVVLSALLASSRIHLIRATTHRFLVASSIYRPPRFV